MQVENWGGTDNILKNNKWYMKKLFVRPNINQYICQKKVPFIGPILLNCLPLEIQ